MFTLTSTPYFIRRIHATIKYLLDLLDGLGDMPFEWSPRSKNVISPILKEMGITLVTKKEMAELGFRLRKPRIKKPRIGTNYEFEPVGYLTSNIIKGNILKGEKVLIPLYFLEKQCVKI